MAFSAAWECVFKLVLVAISQKWQFCRSLLMTPIRGWIIAMKASRYDFNKNSGNDAAFTIFIEAFGTVSIV